MTGQCVISGKFVLVRRRYPRAHVDAIEVLVLESAEFELPKIGATACLMVCVSSTSRLGVVMWAVRSYSISTESEGIPSSAVRMLLIGSFLGHAKLFRASQTAVRANVFGKQRYVTSSKKNTRKRQT
jgi:hypothetical protein